MAAFTAQIHLRATCKEPHRYWVGEGLLPPTSVMEDNILPLKKALGNYLCMSKTRRIEPEEQTRTFKLYWFAPSLQWISICFVIGLCSLVFRSGGSHLAQPELIREECGWLHFTPYLRVGVNSVSGLDRKGRKTPNFGLGNTLSRLLNMKLNGWM